jgi:TonB family protein
MKHLYSLLLIAGIAFCSPYSIAQNSAPVKKTTTAKDSTKQSSTKSTSKTGTATKSNAAKKSDSTKTKSDDGATYGKTKVGPGKGYGEMMTQSPAQYMGGDDSLAVFLSKNFKYMNQNQSNGQHGQVNVGFTIDKTGKIQNPVVLKGSGNKDVDSEALHAVEMMPNWKPGMSGGQPVDVQYILPIDYFIPQ